MENNTMFKTHPHPPCPVVDIDGVMASGKQFDLDITLPIDNRNVIYGTVRNCYKEPVKDAVVKLIEVEFDREGMKKRIPISHTFTDEYGEFVFGPLCPDKEYAIDIWVHNVHNFKMSTKCTHEGRCLKGKPAEIYEDFKREIKKDDKTLVTK